jgi:hypothetical protein
MGFASRILEEGRINLQVWGDCACLGSAYGGLFRDVMEKGFVEYELHNADSQVQRAALYAGIGHLAHLASSE